MTEHSASLVELAKALSKFQGAMQSVPKGSVNPYFHSKYADLDAVWDACRKPLSDNGLALVQTTVDGDGKLYLETLLLHTSGEYISSRYPLFPMKQTKETGWVASDDPQSIGSAITYARRYAMSAMLGVSADEDDDAERATSGGQEREATNAPKDRGHGICPDHNIAWFKSGRMQKPAHPPLEQGGKWCNKEDVEARISQEKMVPLQPTREELFPPGMEAGGIVEPLFPDAPEDPQEAVNAGWEPAEPPQAAPARAHGPGGKPYPLRGEKETDSGYFVRVARESCGKSIGEAYDALGKNLEGKRWTWTAWTEAGHTLQDALDKLPREA